MSTQTVEPKVQPSANLVQIGSVEDIIQQRLAEERARLEREAGVAKREVHHFKRPAERPFTREQRARTTLLFGGLTWKHEKLVHGALEGLGYTRRSRAHAQRPRVPDRQGIRQQRAVQPHLFHRRQPGAVSAEPGRAGAQQAGNHRPLRVLHRRRLRPVPLRHVRSRIPAGAAQRRFRRLPRAAVPAVRRAEPVRRRSRPGDEPRFLPGHPQRAQLRRRDERSGLRHPPLRSRSAGETDAVLDEGMDYLHEVFRKKRPWKLDGNLSKYLGGFSDTAEYHRQVREPAQGRRLRARAEALPRPVQRRSKSTACASSRSSRSPANSGRRPPRATATSTCSTSCSAKARRCWWSPSAPGSCT